jgi:hypothetical protein
MRAGTTIVAMRAALVAGLAAGLLLVAAGCGSSNAATSSVSSDAASLVPPSALAYVSADANLNAGAWTAIKKLTGPLEFDTTAVGDLLNVAVLAIDKGKPEAVAIVKPKDEAKLRTLAAKYDQGNEHYTVQHVGDWSVVADSEEGFQAVRNANAGTSLADTEEFKEAVSQLDGSAVAFVYANGALAKQLPANVRPFVGSPRWFTGQVTGDKNELKLDVRATGWSPATYKPTLLRDVPSDAILALSFKDAAQLPFLKEYLRGITGEGVLYIAPGAILPVITLEVQPRDPAAAATMLRKIAKKVGKNVPLVVERRGAKVLLTTGAGVTTGGKSILDDKSYKDALKAAGVPEQVTFSAYVDANRLAPLIDAFSGLFGLKNAPKLDNVRTFVAFGSAGRIAARVTVK